MGLNISNECYNVIALSTCVANENANGWWCFGKTDQIDFSDELSAIVKYEYISSDEMSLSDYEDHFFCMEFLRGGRFVDHVSFEKKLNSLEFGSLANPELSVQEKLDILDRLRPGLIQRFEALKLHTSLTPEEIELISAKSKELLMATMEKDSGKAK